jgi:hypothetical protein
MFDEKLVMNYLFRKLSVRLLFVLFTFLVYDNKSNNLVIGTPPLVGGILQFTIQWDNSVNTAIGPANIYVIGVFVIRQGCAAAQTWDYALLSTNSANH